MCVCVPKIRPKLSYECFIREGLGSGWTGSVSLFSPHLSLLAQGEPQLDTE